MELPGLNSQLIKGTRSSGIELVLGTEGGVEYVCQTVKKDKKGIVAAEEFFICDSFEKVQEKLSGEIPLQLTFSGKGIIIRKLELPEKEINSVRVLSYFLPGAQAEDFYIQLCPAGEDMFFAAVIRKSIVDDLVNKFINNGFFLTSFSISPFLVASLIPLMKKENAELEIRNYSIMTGGNNITEIKSSNLNRLKGDIELGEYPVPLASFSAFGAALQYFFPEETILTLDTSPVTESHNELKAKLWFRNVGILTLLFFLLVLLLNFFIFSNYDKKRNDLQVRLAASKDLLTEVSELGKQLAERKTFLTRSGLDKPSRKSFFADRISASLPSSIYLSEMNIFPMVQKAKEKEKIEVESGAILIKGECGESIVLNEWLKKIKGFDWIKDVKVLSYKQLEVKASGEFELRITI